MTLQSAPSYPVPKRTPIPIPMSETIASSQQQGSETVAENPDRLRLSLVTAGVLLALTLVVVVLRFHRLSEIPPGLYYDGGSNGLDAVQVLEGKHAIFFPERSNGREWLGIYPIALAISFLGRTMLAVRLPTALTSAATVLAVFWLGQLLFGREEEGGRATPWRGLLIGGVGAGLMAVSLSHTVLGRTAFRVNFVPLLLTLSLGLLWWGWRERGRGRILLAGACAGLLLHTYTPSRITPILFLLFGLSFLLPLRQDAGKKLRTELPRAGLFAGAAALAAAPMIGYFILHPEFLFLRAGQLWIFNPDLNLGSPLGLFLDNVWVYLLSIGIHGDMNWRHNLPGQPLLSPWEALFFLLGVGAAVRRWNRPAYRLLLLWLGALVLPALLAIEGTPRPNTVRIIGALPAIYLLAAAGMWEAFNIMKVKLPALSVRVASIFHTNRHKAGLAAAAVLGMLILGKGVHTYRIYFEEWATAPGLHWAYQVGWKEWAEMMNALPSDANMVYLVPRAGSSGHNSFEFLYNGAASVHVIDTTLPFMPQKVESALVEMKELSTVRVLDWNDDMPHHSDEEEYIVALLNKHGRFVGSEQHAAFQIHAFSDIGLDLPLTLNDYLVPRTVVYDGGITLLGFALGQGGQQLAAEDIVNVGADRALWAVLQLQTAAGLGIDYTASLRLHDAEGEKAFQHDAPLMALHHLHTSRWNPAEAVDNLFHFDIPADLQPGEYELRLVIYDSETHKPVAELDVWETEIVLARLQLAELP